MKQLYLLTFIMNLLSFSLIQAQNWKPAPKSTIDLLTAHAWVNEDETYFAKFDRTDFSSYENLEKYDLGKSSGTHKYYLSDNNNFVGGVESGKIDFKEHLVGKVSNGIYFITPERTFWIIEISENSFTFIALAPFAKRLKMKPYYGEFPTE